MRVRPKAADPGAVSVAEEAGQPAAPFLALAASAALLWLVVLPGELVFFLVWR